MDISCCFTSTHYTWCGAESKNGILAALVIGTLQVTIDANCGFLRLISKQFWVNPLHCFWSILDIC